MSTFTVLNPAGNKEDTFEATSDTSLIFCEIISTKSRGTQNFFTKTKFTQLWVCDRCGTLGVDNHTSREKCDHEAISLRFAEIF